MLRGPQTRGRTGRTGIDLAVAVLLVVLVGSGCGTSEPGGGPSATDGPRVAHPRFDGDFVIARMELDGSPATLVQRPGLLIETEFGGLTVQPGCNTYFGSFTLTEDGVASFTVTGGSQLDCGDLSTQEAQVLAALADVEAWESVDGGFRFTGPSSSLTVIGP